MPSPTNSTGWVLMTASTGEEQTPTPTCAECGTEVSYETGFTMTGGLGDSSEDRLWCPEHAPKQGEGYTLSDLQRMLLR